MKRLFFDKLTVVSHKEKAARVIPFDRKLTVIKGKNDVGKSSLIKALLKTFGTEPQMETPQWLDAAVVSVVDFTVDDAAYSILRSKSSFGLFDGNGKLLSSHSSVMKGLSPAIAKLFNFHLTMESKGAGPMQAPPAFLFLPFYFDQDKSWTSQFDSFKQLMQFPGYRNDVVAYHTGIQPNEFYLAKADKLENERKLEECKQEREVLMRAIKRVESLFDGTLPSISVDDFKQEVDQLLRHGEELAQREMSIRDNMIAVNNLQVAVESQLAILLRAANELGDDFQYAAVDLGDFVDCPTCGAHYENSIAERFAIAEDEHECRELIESLQEEKRRLESQYAMLLSSADVVSAEVKHVGELLAVKRGEVNLRQIVQSEGRKEVRHALYKDVDATNKSIGELDQKIENATKVMRSVKSPKRTSEIRSFYKELINVYLEELAVDSREGQYDSMTSKIAESGSDAPRAILAYQFAILHTIAEYSTSTFCPIVIDSPKQQDQDDDNWAKILAFVQQRSPEHSQVVLAFVDEGVTRLEGMVHVLEDERRVLRTDQYESASARVQPMHAAIVSSLL